jgi:competence protein ComEC
LLLIYLSCAWITGILLGSKFSLYPAWLDLALLPLPLLFFYWHKKKLIVSASLIILALLGGIVRFRSTLPVADENSVQFYNDKAAVVLKGTISQAPDIRDKSTHIYLAHIQIKTADKWKQLNGQALLFVPRFPEYNYGDVLQVKGKLETPQAIEDFDYAGYLANQGIYSTMLSPK